MAKVTYLGQAKMYSGDGVCRYTLPAYSMNLNLDEYYASGTNLNIYFEGIFESNSKSMAELQRIYELPSISNTTDVTSSNSVTTGHNPAVALYQSHDVLATYALTYPDGVNLKDGVFNYSYDFKSNLENSDHPALLYNEYYGGWSLCMLYLDVNGTVTGVKGQIYATTKAANWVGRKDLVTQIDFDNDSPVQINPALLVQSFFTGQAVRRSRGKPVPDITDAELVDGVLYIRNAVATLNQNVLEVV